MKKNQIQSSAQRGFTLIELVMVIVILGILAAVALPKFVDLSGEASQAAVEGMAGAISSGSAANFAAKKVGSASAVTIAGDAVCTKQALDPLVQGGLPGSYSVLISSRDIVDPNLNSGNCTTADTAKCTIFDGKSNRYAQATVYCAR